MRESHTVPLKVSGFPITLVQLGVEAAEKLGAADLDDSSRDQLVKRCEDQCMLSAYYTAYQFAYDDLEDASEDFKNCTKADAVKKVAEWIDGREKTKHYCIVEAAKCRESNRKIPLWERYEELFGLTEEEVAIFMSFRTVIEEHMLRGPTKSEVANFLGQLKNHRDEMRRETLQLFSKFEKDHKINPFNDEFKIERHGNSSPSNPFSDKFATETSPHSAHNVGRLSRSRARSQFRPLSRRALL